MKKNNNKLNKTVLSSKKQGFTLVEVIISIGIFVVIIAGSSGVFIMALKSYRGAKNVNENLKNAQSAMNLMSKTFRTSSIVSSNATSIVVYDYSRTSNGCIRYRFYNNSLMEGRVNVVGATSPARFSACAAVSGAAFTTAERPMTSGMVSSVSFSAVASAGVDSNGSSTAVGKVTVMMDIYSGTGSERSSARIQSTSSLRDYSVSNVGIDPNNPI